MSQRHSVVSEILGIGNLYQSALNVGVKQTRQGKQPLVILFCWLGASEKALQNYVNLYTDKVVDCLVIPGYLTYFLRPLRGMEVAKRILNYLIYEQDNYDQYFIHAFSIGAFMVNLIAVHIRDNAEQFCAFQTRLRALIMDSVSYGSLENMAEGVAESASAYPFLRWIYFNIVKFLFRLSPWTVHLYEDILALIFSAPFDVPSLFYCSLDDPICNFTELEKLTANWRHKLTCPVVLKSWEKSVHTAHIRFHKDEYVYVFKEFCKLVPNFFPTSTPINSKL